MNAYALVNGLARVCEYTYRKGVADAASYGDTDEVKRVAQREDGYSTIRFLDEEDGQLLPFEHYKDYLVIYAGIVRAMEFRNFMIYQVGMKNMKYNLCTIADYVYRKGLLEGIQQSKNEGIQYLKNVGTGIVHIRPDGTKPNTLEWIEEIKHLCNKIHNRRKRDGLPTSMNKLSEFIGQTILNQKLLKENEA